MVEVNLLSPMTATEVFLPKLREGGGDLVNISSVAGRTARAGNSAYAAAKRGMNGWSEALRQGLQLDVRVTVIHPDARCDRADRPHHQPLSRHRSGVVVMISVRWSAGPMSGVSATW
jgi:NAD(P)-dependent dehydrogenase (short-subunit alcohol dehydrogenase family)